MAVDLSRVPDAGHHVLNTAVPVAVDLSPSRVPGAAVLDAAVYLSTHEPTAVCYLSRVPDAGVYLGGLAHGGAAVRLSCGLRIAAAAQFD